MFAFPWARLQKSTSPDIHQPSSQFEVAESVKAEMAKVWSVAVTTDIWTSMGNML